MKTSISIILLLFILIFSCFTPVYSESQKLLHVDGVSFAVEAPQGWCFIKPARIEAALGHPSSETTLAAFVPYTQLANAASNWDRVLPYGAVIMVSNNMVRRAIPGSRARMIAILDRVVRQSVKQSGSVILDDNQRLALNPTKLGLAPGEIKIIGTFRPDTNAAYFVVASIIQSNHGDFGISIAAMTAVKKRQFTYALYRSYHGPDTIRALIGVARKCVARFVAINESSSGRVALRDASQD